MKDQPRLSTDLPRSLNDENTLEARVKHGRSRRVCAHTVSFPGVTPPGDHERGLSVRLRLLPLHMARTVVVIRLCAVVSGTLALPDGGLVC